MTRSVSTALCVASWATLNEYFDITILEDAHMVSPFGGERVNAAMQDAAGAWPRLAGIKDWNEAIKVCEAGL